MQYILSLTFIGVLTGIVAGILGGGSEILIVPLMTLFGLYSTFKERVGTSLFMLLPPIGVWAGINYYRKGFVDIAYLHIIVWSITYLVITCLVIT